MDACPAARSAGRRPSGWPDGVHTAEGDQGCQIRHCNKKGTKRRGGGCAAMAAQLPQLPYPYQQTEFSKGYAECAALDAHAARRAGQEGFAGNSTPLYMYSNPGAWASLMGVDFVRNNKAKGIDYATMHAYTDQWLCVSEGATTQGQLDFLKCAPRPPGRPLPPPPACAAAPRARRACAGGAAGCVLVSAARACAGARVRRAAAHVLARRKRAQAAPLAAA